jgi:hypothetical protein
LAKITVVVDDLVDRVTLPQQLGPVQGGTCADFGQRGRPVGSSEIVRLWSGLVVCSTCSVLMS